MNDDPTLTKHRAEHLAAFLRTLRHDWDEPGIVAALHKARHRGTAVDIAIAATRCASDQGNRTPAVIALDGRHWRSPDAEHVQTTPMPPRIVTCEHCGGVIVDTNRDEHLNRRCVADHQAGVYESGAAAAKAALADARRRTTTEEETSHG